MEENKKNENEKLTKEKLKEIVKYLPEIIRELNKPNNRCRKRRGMIEIDEDVIAVLKIIEDIIEYENIEWLRKWIIELKSDKTDIRLLADMPISRTEYYLLKGKLVDKIYSCCACKGMVDYEDALRERID